MTYFFKSILTLSFWRFALFSQDAAIKVLAAMGGLYGFVEMLDFFGIYTKDRYSGLAIIPMLLAAIILVVVTRRPVSRISYKPLGKDYRIDVRIGDLFSGTGDVVVSTNTTFDTDMASGLIDAGSLQGQVATQFFQTNTKDIDQQLENELQNVPSTERADALGKKREYPIGTVARVRSHSRTFYFIAMSRLNDAGTAGSTKRDVEDALDKLWAFIAERGNHQPIAIPLMGTGRGRIPVPRKKVAEMIAQSFAEASAERIFSAELSIVIRPQDAERFEVNLYQIRDYLVQSLHS
ncbi:DUF6430 domain-containing protein [Sphingopyxis sp. BSN-002]|jgi:hypothetical protein|uniref:macro domain-containing protein n=1 Tax=Sphingopyxis sp. BSN-002 TaxID=2911495 RepID=UPI001EDBA61B|nr:macro domain-containing protein [Sphingopyxis sp. BSN-002]UKK86184.1 DUF6430 domain-containing protein [Sphingopyxis sp. BSN-002]